MILLQRILVVSIVAPYTILALLDYSRGKPRMAAALVLVSIVNVLVYWR